MDHEREPGTARFGNFINYYSFNPAERRIKLLPSQSSDILDCVCSRRSMSATPGQEAVKENKVVMLDIGSNAGVLTIEAYRYFNESFSQSGQGSIEGPIEEYQEPDQNTDLQILGVDLDAKLVERSNENNPYPKNLTFRVADLMNETHRDGLIDEVLRNFSLPQFHLTMCFSVTLWIHLNHGDEGLKDFLRYISKISQFLLIEPQPWKCYRTAVRRMKKLNCEPFQHFPGLQWKEHVDEEILNFLITECGMVLKERYGKTEWDRTVCFLENKI